jgi:hypothetical protein
MFIRISPDGQAVNNPSLRRSSGTRAIPWRMASRGSHAAGEPPPDLALFSSRP